MSTSLQAFLQARLDRVRTDGRWRRLRTLDGPQQPEQVIDGQPVVAFCSNDYLGLAADPAVAAAAREALDRYGFGAGAAHLINGHTRAHVELEQALARFTGRERALLFSTGYMANLALVQTLAGRHDTVFEDRWNHASLIDAVRLAGARSQRYRHADPGHLRDRLERAPDRGHRLVVTDGVFSMDGDIAPLPELAALAREFDAWLMVDDAHGLSVLGATGGGSCQHHGLGADDVPILMGTLGKGFGAAGAFVAGSEALIETLIQTARPYIYTTAMPAALAAATLASVRIAEAATDRRAHLQDLLQRLGAGLDRLGLQHPPPLTPIQPVQIGDAHRASDVAERLLAAGFLVPAIRPPTVPEGQARLRITLSAAHTEAQVDALLRALEQALDHATP
ncbi:8-amino-7-oxononanoate synthase [Thioalkalivibrio sp. K90mix]|uniref:8-amino-7-oxononanoate synthase n=1 Tax=unclassified Thioalkalivibrio TaxID=2621013 RepID=UPI0001959C1C|nr:MULTISPECIES: 8-amino-7-oxononanoate synthase [unclassified Thioalkalivibrio]ADC72778.1 8-amino-7-oxononanoate synthase [Thioalkalivibrio sp. K90mix]